MNDYQKKIDGFRSLYWENPNTENEAMRNGFTVYPEDTYNKFLPYIQNRGRVLDLGCGTGLLLKHIFDHSSNIIEPFGVDFLEEAINSAKTRIFPEYKSNFFLAQITTFFTSIKFDYIIFEPSLIFQNDRKLFTDRLLTYLEKDGKIVVYSYHDSMEAYGYASFKEYFQNCNYEFICCKSYPESGIDIGVLNKTKSSHSSGR